MIFVAALLVGIFLLSSPWTLVVIAVGGVVEILESGFWLWYSKRRRAQVGAETLIGQTADVVRPCLPDGQVRVAGELWQARCPTGAESGTVVRVLAREGLVLVVEPVG